MGTYRIVVWARGSFDGAVREQRRELIAVVQRHPPVAGADRTSSDPGDLALDAELVELGAPVDQASRENLALQHRGWDLDRLKLVENIEHRRTAAGRWIRDAVPCGQEPGEPLGIHRLDLMAQDGERSTFEPPQDLHVDPFLAGSTGPEGSACHAAGRLELGEGRVDHPAWQTQGGCGLVDSERAVGSSETADDVSERIGNRFEEHLGHPLWRLDAECVPQPTCVLDRSPPCVARHVHSDDPACSFELFEEVEGVGLGASDRRRRRSRAGRDP